MSAVINSPNPILRPLTTTDLDHLMVIENEAYDYPWTHRIFSDCLRAGYDAWCLVIDNDLLGYSVMSKGAGEAHILNITVIQKYQQQGHGRRLLQHMVHQAWRYQIELVLLEVRPSNKNAIRLYESAGFNELGRRPNYYPSANGREDAVIFGCVPEPSD